MERIGVCILYMVLLLLLSGCNICDKDHCVEMPEPFKFKIIDRDSNEDIVFTINPRYHRDSIRLFYFGTEGEIEIPLDTIGYDRHRVFSTQTLPLISAIEFRKDFYLQLSFNDIDTLLIDVKQIDLECCTVFQYAGSYINGQLFNKSRDDYTIFLVEK
jgi:hypothetical protein